MTRLSMTNRLFREKLDEAVTKLVNRLIGTFASRDYEFLHKLNAMLLSGLSDPKNARKHFLYSLFGRISGLARSELNLEHYRCNSGVLPEFYKQTLAHNKDSATELLQRILEQVSLINEFAVLEVLQSLVEEPSLVDTPSPEVQTWLETFVEAYITKIAGKEPEKPGTWARPAELCDCDSRCKVCLSLNSFLTDRRAEDITIALADVEQGHTKLSFPYLKTENGSRLNEVRFIKTLEQWEACYLRWESRVKEAQEKLREELPKLKQVLGDDKYNWPKGGTAQAVDEAQPPSKRKGEDTINAGLGKSSKRVRLSGKDNED